MPELKGRTLEEIDELFERRIPAWKFKTTAANIGDEARREIKIRNAHDREEKTPVVIEEDNRP